MRMLKKHNYQWFFYFPQKTLLILIRVYQKTLSPDHGLLKFKHPFGYCRFQPTCSNYAIDAIKKHGIIKGIFKAIWRILRCNPWSKGGYDPM